MTKRSREHSADEFGNPASGSIRGLDPPMIGAASSIMVDALVEQESGRTPPPPPVSVRAISIALGVMFALGFVLLFLARAFFGWVATP